MEIWFSLYRWLIRYLLLLFGVSGSVIGTILFSNKKMKKFPARRMYRFLLIIDAIYLTSQIVEDTMNMLGFRLRFLSNIICKIYIYYNFSVGPISAWVLLFISIDRCIIIAFKGFKIIRKPRFQNLMIVLIISYNILFYSPYLVFIELTITQMNETNNTQLSFLCDFTQEYYSKILYMSDLVNSTLIPFLLMFLTSIVLIYSIIRTRLNILNLILEQDKKKLRKDIHFAVTILFLDFSFFILNLPICLANYFFIDSVDNILYGVFTYLFYLSFCINFYILALFNSVFKKELFVFFKFLKCKQNNAS